MTTEPTETPDRLLTVEEAAEYLGTIPVGTVRNLVKAKQIGHVKIGRSTAFRREHLDTYIDEHTVKPQENPWGMTDAAVRSVRSARTERRAS